MRRVASPEIRNRLIESRSNAASMGSVSKEPPAYDGVLIDESQQFILDGKFKFLPFSPLTGPRNRRHGERNTPRATLRTRSASRIYAKRAVNLARELPSCFIGVCSLRVPLPSLCVFLSRNQNTKEEGKKFVWTCQS